MEAMIYTKAVLDHFLNPRNVGRPDQPFWRASVASESCNDHLDLALVIRNGHIVEAKFLATACAIATASLSALTLVVPGLSVDEAKGLDVADLEKILGPLPSQKLSCARLPLRVLVACLALWETGATE
jgi:NifU-like protein involved in Fe-S cluster formation